MLVERQVEARTAGADVAHKALDAGVTREKRFHLFGLLERRGKRRALRQAQIDEQVGTARGRKELLRNQPENRQRAGENHQRRQQNDAPVIDAPRDHRAEAAIKRRLVNDLLIDGPGQRDGRARDRLAAPAPRQPQQKVARRPVLHVGQHLVAQVRDHDHGGEPRCDERDGRHLKNRTCVLAGRRLRHGDGQKTGDGDQRSRQHRKCRARVGEARRAHAVEALLHLDDHHLDGDDRIIDQEAERQDQRAERNLVQADAEHPHEHESHRQHQRDRYRHNEAGAQAQADQAHRQHDDHGFGERAHEFVDRALHGARHARHRVDVDAHRQARLDARDFALECAAEIDHVTALRHRNAETERFAPHEAHARDRRIHVIAVDARDVAKPEQPAVRPDRDVAYVIGRPEFAADAHVYAVGRGMKHARRRHCVLRLQGLDHELRVEPKIGELQVGNLDEYLFVLLADVVDLRDVGHVQQLAADAVRVLL